MYSNSKERRCFKSTRAKSSLNWLIVFALMSLVFAGMGFAGTIQGVKFYDRNANGVFDAGEETFANDVIFVRDVRPTPPPINTNTFRADANGYYSLTNIAAGNYETWSPLHGWVQTAPKVATSSSDNYYFSIGATETKTINFGITDTIAPPPPPDPACIQVASRKSVKIGNWDDKTTWSPEGIPAPGEVIWIEADHTITVPDVIDLGMGSLCNKGKIKSRDNQPGMPASRVEIHAVAIQNQGIIGKENDTDKTMDGANGNCWTHSSAGSSIQLFATLFSNDNSGIIHAGNGGTDNPGGGCYVDVCNAFGGEGGKVEIFTTTTMNLGTIQSGNGGTGNGCHASSVGGNGGLLRIMTDAYDPNNPSESTGRLIAGNGGGAGGGSLEVGIGGDIDLLMARPGGVVEGRPGSVTYVDPIQLKALSNLTMRGSDGIVFYTDEGGTLDFTQLKGRIEAISANKFIRIFTKARNGQGGTVDLRGLSGKVFKAGEKVEIFADKVMTDPGVTVQSLFNAPSVVVSPGKILYRVAVSAEKMIVGKASQKVTVPVRIINTGSKMDEYSVKAISSLVGWKIVASPSVLSPNTLTIGGIYYKDLNLDITFPTNAVPGTQNKITVTATSKTDPLNVKATAEIIAVIPATDSDGDSVPDADDVFPNDPQEWADSDSDGIGNNADPDDDNDGMTDECEVNYNLNPYTDDASQDADNDGYTNLEECKGINHPTPPSEDDSITFSGSGGYKTVVTPIPNGVQGEMQVKQESDGTYKGSDGASSIVVTPDPAATGDAFTVTTGKNLTDNGEPLVFNATPNSDGSYTYSDPATPSVGVKVNENGSYTVTDTETPGVVLNGNPDGSQTVTDEESPGMTYKLDVGGSQIVTDEEFPGMTATVGLDNNLTVKDNEFSGMTYTVGEDNVQTVTDTAYPDTKAVVNADGTYTVTDTEFPGVVITYDPATDTFTGTDAEAPGIKININSDGSYTVTDQDGKCYDINKARGLGKWFKKVVNKVAKVINKVAGFVKKVAKFVSKVAKFVSKVAKFVGSVAKFLKKNAPIIATIVRGIGKVALAIGSFVPPLCPLACTIAAFTERAATYIESQKFQDHMQKVQDVAKKIEEGANNVADIAGKVENGAAKTQEFATKVEQNTSRRRLTRSNPPTDCQSVTLYKAYGTITDNAGNAMVNVAVRVHDTSETTNENDVITATDNTGRWEVICLENGNYTATATKTGYTFDEKSFTVSGLNTEVAINMTSDQPVPGMLPMYIGDDDGFGFDLSNAYKGANGEPVDHNSNGKLECGDVLPDLNGDGKVNNNKGNGDNFDNRSVAEKNDASGAEWTDISLARDWTYNEKPGLAKDVVFNFKFTIPANYPNVGKEHYVSFVYGDYDVGIMKAKVEGNIIRLKGNKDGGFNGYIWRAYAPVAWNDMLDGEVTIEIMDASEINPPDGRIEPYVAFDYAVLDIKPITTPEPDTEFSFDNGILIVDEDGNLCIDWLYDGGAYRGEMGIFTLLGMEKLTPGSKAFNAEVVRRVLSNSQEGYLVISDPNECARFSGQLGGEPTDWNSGKYNGIKCFNMRPGAWFATVLVPNSTFKELAKDPGTTSSFKRPLYSLVASNPAYGMYLGQVADINKLGNAFVYEDICASNSDKDYNDLIFQITGAATADIQTLDSLAWKVPAKTRAARRDWTDWRTDSELGRQIMEHLEALQSVNSETERITVTLDAPADIQISDSEGGVIGKEGGYIAGALFGTDENGNKYVSLIKSESGEYRVVVQGLGKDEAALLNVKEYKGESEISSVSLPFATAPHQTLSTVVSTGASASVPVPVGCVYDFDGDSDIDIADVMKVASIWGTGMGNEEYDGFYDLNDSGKIELSDIMKVVNLEGCKQ